MRPAINPLYIGMEENLHKNIEVVRPAIYVEKKFIIPIGDTFINVKRNSRRENPSKETAK
jgi:hypothetical protein